MKKILCILFVLLLVFVSGCNTTNTDNKPEPEPDEENVVNPYKEKILSVNKLFDVGEKNLSEEDYVEIDGKNFYVLDVKGDSAFLMSVDIYKSTFDTVNKQASYHGSTLQSFDRLFWSENFIKNKYILDTKVEAAVYPRGIFPDGKEFVWDTEKENSYTPSQIKYLKTYSIQARELSGHIQDFNWEPKSDYDHGFWIAVGQEGVFDEETMEEKDALAFYVTNTGELSYASPEVELGERPVMWISLGD